ncbi:hypothetical protein [Herbaspirillum seropedicae]|uniref:hypothetical protein n=1 Tax=Herbaspirillum seropedicae TaxID=964 RepID=UPI003FCED13D
MEKFGTSYQIDKWPILNVPAQSVRLAQFAEEVRQVSPQYEGMMIWVGACT